MNRKTVLIVDDEVKFSINLSKFISKLGYSPIVASNVKDAKEMLKESKVDIVISDIVMPGEDGMSLLKHIKQNKPHIKVILVTGFTTVEITLQAIKYKVDAFLEKPLTFDKLENELKRVETIETVIKESKPETKKIRFIKKHNIVMSSNSSMLEMVDFLELIADKKASVFIYGESGTGKELIAKALHKISKRGKSPFVAINCGAIPESLIESELFGHTKGSFTGAISDKTGRIELADRGTLFLDEIGELSVNMQVKFLRVLQERKILPIGAKKEKSVDFRLVSATNINLEEAIKDKNFREDLFYRVNVIPIVLPPLRDRKEDIPALVEYFITENNKIHETNILGVTREAMDLFINYLWPGNIRELQNLIERLTIIKDEGYIESKDLPDRLIENQTQTSAGISTMLYNDQVDNFDFKQMMESYQKEILLYALKRTNWNKKKAAEFLNLKRTTFVEMLKRLDISSNKK